MDVLGLQLSGLGRLLRWMSFGCGMGILWAFHGLVTAEEMGPLVYLLFWLPVWVGATIVTFGASFTLPQAATSPLEAVTRGEQRLNLLVHVLMAAGGLGLLGEALAIAFEGKQLQAAELVVLTAAVLAFRIWVHGMTAAVRARVNVATIVGLVALGAGWWWVLDAVLAVFDR